MRGSKSFVFIKEKIISSTPAQLNEMAIADIIKREYVLLKLKATQKSPIELKNYPNITFTLVEQHLTFHENIDPNNAALSEYHHTAVFQDFEGDCYRSHVYFDHQDHVKKVQFARKLANGECSEVDVSDAFRDKLEQLAIDESNVTICSIRLQQADFLTSLKNRYEAATAHLTDLSVNLPMSKLAYIKQIEVCLEMLRVLEMFDDQAIHSQLIKLFTRIKINLRDVSENDDDDSSDYTSSDDENDNNTKKNTFRKKQSKKPVKATSATAVASIKKVRIREIMPLEGLVAKAEASLADYKAVPVGSSNKQKAQLIGHCENWRANLMAAMMSKQYSVTANDLQKINAYIATLQIEGERLLTRVAVSGDFECANLLLRFMDGVAPSLMRLALRLDNEKMLSYLLKNAVIPINTFVVENGLNPVLYCLHDSTKYKEKCLSVLIASGASLLMRNRDGVPAVLPLLQVNHPLHDLLLDNSNKTLLSKSFVKQLIHLVKGHIEANPNDNALSKTLNGLTRLLDGLEANTVTSSTITMQRKLAAQVRPFVGDSLHDERLVIAYGDMAAAVVDFCKTQPKKTVRSMTQMSATLADMIDVSLLKQVKELGVEFLLEVVNSTTQYFRAAAFCVENADRIRLPIFNHKKERAKLVSKYNENFALVKSFQKIFKSNSVVDDRVLDLDIHEELLVDLTGIRQRMLDLIKRTKALKLKFEAEYDVVQIAGVLQELADVIALNTESLVTIDVHEAALKDYSAKLISGATSEELASSKDAFYESWEKIKKIGGEPKAVSHLALR